MRYTVVTRPGMLDARTVYHGVACVDVIQGWHRNTCLAVVHAVYAACITATGYDAHPHILCHPEDGMDVSGGADHTRYHAEVLPGTVQYYSAW